MRKSLMPWNDNKQRNTKEKGYPNKNWRIRTVEEKEHDQLLKDYEKERNERVEEVYTGGDQVSLSKMF